MSILCSVQVYTMEGIGVCEDTDKNLLLRVKITTSLLDPTTLNVSKLPERDH